MPYSGLENYANKFLATFHIIKKVNALTSTEIIQQLTCQSLSILHLNIVYKYTISYVFFIRSFREHKLIRQAGMVFVLTDIEF